MNKKQLSFVTVAIALIGLILMAAGAVQLSILRGQLVDKNGDGVIDWHDADVNKDGVVSGLDLGLIANAFPPKPYNSTYDLNNDGVIDEADISICTAYFGSGTLNLLSLTSALFTGSTTFSQIFLVGLGISIVGLVSLIAVRAKTAKRRKAR